MIKVYIAGPYTKGDVALNVRAAYIAADQIANAGGAPFVPHHTHFWHMMFPRPYEEWLKLDLAFLPVCDCVLRLPGESSGADGEVAKAIELGLPIFYTLDGVILMLQRNGRIQIEKEAILFVRKERVQCPFDEQQCEYPRCMPTGSCCQKKS